MEPNKDEKIQSILEAKQDFDSIDKDAENYRTVFDALKKEPGNGFSMSFTANIIRVIEARQDRKFFYITYGLFALALIAGISFMLLFLVPAFFALFTGTLSQYKWTIIFVVCIIIVIQLLDKKVKAVMN